MQVTIQINTGENPDPTVLQQLLIWAAKADTAVSRFTQFTHGETSRIDATGINTVMLGHSAHDDKDRGPADVSEAEEDAGDEHEEAGPPATGTQVAGAADPAKPKRGRGRPKAAAVEQQNTALSGVTTTQPVTQHSAGALPPGAALPPGMAPPVANGNEAQHPAPVAPVVQAQVPVTQMQAPAVQTQAPAMPTETQTPAAAIPPVVQMQVQPQAPAMPAVPPAGDSAGGPSLEDLRACVTQLTAVKPGAPFKVMSSGSWPSDNSPKARYFTVESIPAAERERMIAEIGQYCAAA